MILIKEVKVFEKTSKKEVGRFNLSRLKGYEVSGMDDE